MKVKDLPRWLITLALIPIVIENSRIEIQWKPFKICIKED